MNLGPALSTARLTMRPPQAPDIGAYRAFYAVSDLTEGGYRGGRSAAEVEGILARDMAHWRAKGFGMWLLRRDGDGGDGGVIGGAGLSHPDGWPSHELTWWLMPTARGAGYAAEASRAVIAWAADALGWPFVETHMRDGNAPARRLAQRLGGVVDRRETFPDGVTRDIFRMTRAAA